jgi:hypothetical protein
VKSKRRLYAIDIDKTLCDSRAADVLLPTNDSSDFTDWHNAIKQGKFPVVKGSVKGVRRVLKNPNNVVVLLTARNEILWVETKHWVCKHFPMLSETEISMRRITDYRTSVKSKGARLEVLKRRYGISTVVVIDDEPYAAALAQGKNDRFIQIKKCKWETKDV